MALLPHGNAQRNQDDVALLGVLGPQGQQAPSMGMKEAVGMMRNAQQQSPKGGYLQERDASVIDSILLEGAMKAKPSGGYQQQSDDAALNNVLKVPQATSTQDKIDDVALRRMLGQTPVTSARGQQDDAVLAKFLHPAAGGAQEEHDDAALMNLLASTTPVGTQSK